MDSLYNNIKARRKELGLSQEELAKKMGYTSRSTIAKIENGCSDIPQSKIKAFADALETTPLALLGLSDENPCNTDVLSEEILRLSAALNDVGKQRTIEYIQMLSSNPTFQKPPTKTVSLPIAARGPQGSRHTLTQEEYQEAENTKFDEISPQKQLPKF